MGRRQDDLAVRRGALKDSCLTHHCFPGCSQEYIGTLKKGVFHGKARFANPCARARVFAVTRQGTRTWPNGDRYAGNFKHGMQEGEVGPCSLLLSTLCLIVPPGH